MLEKKIGKLGRDSFFFSHFLYLELYHNYQVYLDFEHNFLSDLFDYPKMCLKVLTEWQTDPTGAVWSRSTQFAKTFLSEYLA